MGQKIHPTGFRLSVTRNWASLWYANKKNFAPTLAADIKIREYLKKKLAHASVAKVTIERPAKNARITIHSARPGVVIGKKGEDIETLRTDLRRMMGGDVGLNIEEIRKPEIDAQLVADSIAQQLVKRIMFRRAMKRAIQNAMRLGAQGIKLMSSGRLNGIEIARCEWYREGRVPLHTLKADIDYGFSEAKTTYGIIGVKCWVYRGDRLANGEAPGIVTPPGADDDRRSRRPGGRPGGPGAPGGRGRPGGGSDRGGPQRQGGGTDRPAVVAAAADAGAAPASAPGASDAPKGPALKRVRKAVAPAAGEPPKGEGKGE